MNGIEANTVLNFIEYTPDVPTPTPTPTPDPGIIGGLTAQTGDFVAMAIGILGIIAAISLAFVFRRHISYNFKSLLAAFCVSILPLVLAGACISGINAAAHDAGALVSKQIDVYVNTQGGPVHYGEGDRSNVQTYTNTTDKPIFIDEIALELTGTSSVDIGKWNAKKDGETIFSGVAGDSQKLANSIFLDPNEGFEVTWETEASSEDLLGLVGTAPVRISYKTYKSQCTVTFETNGGSSIEPAKVIYGETLTKPADPVKDNNVLKYWATDEALTQEYDFSTAVTSNFTLYAYWNASEEYKEEIEEEMAADLKEAKKNLDTIEGLTAEQKKALADALDSLEDEYVEKIKNAATQDEVDDLKAEFEDKVLGKEKEALGQAVDNKETDVDGELDEIEGLTPTDLGRFKNTLGAKKQAAKDNIDEADNFADAQKEQQKFDSDSDALLEEAEELGAAKVEAKIQSSEEAKKSADQFMAQFTGSLLPETLDKFMTSFDNIDKETKENIDDATSPSEVKEALDKEQEDFEALFAQAQEILTTKAAYEKESKDTRAKDEAEITALKEVQNAAKEKARKSMDAELKKLTEGMKATDDLDELKELKDTFDANMKKIMDDIKALDTGIASAKEEIKQQAKNISEDIQSRSEINNFDKGNLEGTLSQLSESIQNALSTVTDLEKLQKMLNDGKASLEYFNNSIVVIELKFASGQESMAEYINPSDPAVPSITTRAGLEGSYSTAEVVISAEKTRIQKIEDNTGRTYTTTDNVFQFFFNKNVTSITTTLEQIPDEAYAYISSSSENATNDTLTFVYDDKRSEKPESTTFDTEYTDLIEGPGWKDYMSGSKISITKIVVDESFSNAQPRCLASWFTQSTDTSKQILKEMVGLGNINTSMTTHFNNAFYSNANFHKFEGLEKWDVSNAQSIIAMFWGCTSLKDVSNMAGWRFNKKLSLNYMFYNCTSLENFAGFNKNYKLSANNTYNMFSNCSALTFVDVSNFILTSTLSREMFSGCTKLQTILYSSDVSSSIGESTNMFQGCSALPHFNEGAVDATYAYPNNGVAGYFTDPHPTIVLNAFTGGHYEDLNGNTITQIKGDWDSTDTKVKVALDDTSASILSVKDNTGRDYDLIEDNYFVVDFSARYSITVTTTSGFTAKAVYTTENSTLTFYFDNITHPGTSISVPESTSGSKSPFEQAKNVKTVIFDESFSEFKKITGLKYWFYQFSQLEEVVDIKNLYTDNVDNTYRMFAESGIRHVDLSSNRFYSLSLQSSLDAVFERCHNLESVIFPDEIVENATCAWTFSECENLLYVNCGKLKMNQAGLYPAFNGCVRLNTITVNNSWPRNLSSMLAEISPNFSTWHVESTGQDVLSSTIYGNTNGDTYTRVEAYAALTTTISSNDTLELRFDSNIDDYDTTFTNILEDSEYPKWKDAMMGDNPTITTVKIDQSFSNAKPVRTSYWFAQNSNDATKRLLNEITGLQYINTSEVLRMESMFYYSNLASFEGMQGWNVSKVKYFDRMFCRCGSLVNLPDLSSWRLDEAIGISGMFRECDKLTNAAFMSSWGAKKVVYLDYLFYGNIKLVNAPDLSNWNLTNVTVTECMFNNCSSLESIPNINDWGFEILRNCNSMFALCSGLKGSLDLSSWKFTADDNLVFTEMFSLAYNLSTIDVSNFPFSSTSKTRGMFSRCGALTKIYCDTNATNILPANSTDMFFNCSNLHNFDGTVVDSTYAFPDTGTEGYFTSKTPTIQLTGFADETEGHFEKEGSAEHIDSITGDLGSLAFVYAKVADASKTITIKDNAGNSYTSDTDGKFQVQFDYCYTITVSISSSEAYAYLSSSNGENDTLTFTYDSERSEKAQDTTFDVVYAGDLPGWTTYMWSQNPSIETVVVNESFKDARPTKLDGWFRQNNDPSLRKLKNISGLQYIDTSSATSAKNTFSYLTGVNNLDDVSSWDVSNINNYYNMFSNCSTLTSLPNFTGWKIPDNANFQGMFGYCSNASKFLGFNKDSVLKAGNMCGMFQHCSELTMVDLGSMSFENIPDVGFMFIGCGKLKTILCDKRIESNYSQDMFTNCSSLPHYETASQAHDVTFAYPNNGTDGFLTHPHPTITLNPFTGGYYEDVAEQGITSISGDWDEDQVRVKVVVTDSSKKVQSVMDNAGNEYTLTNEGYFTVDFSAVYTITVTLQDKASPKAVYDSGDLTFTLYYDDEDHTGANKTVYQVINTSWDVSTKTEGVLAPWCTKYTSYDLVFPNVSAGINPDFIIIDSSFKNCTKDSTGADFHSMSFWFAGMNSVMSVTGLDNIPSCVDDVSGLFSKYSAGTQVYENSHLNLSNFNSENITNAKSMLAGTWFDKVTVPGGFLSGINNVGGFVKYYDGSTLMGVRGLGVFSEMKTFTLDIKGKIFGDVTNADLLFFGCQQLTSLSLTPDVIDLSNLASAQYMFYSMTSLEELDLSGHSAMPIQHALQMFANSTALNAIYLEHDLSTTINTETTKQMFTGCTSLMGGDGFKCDGVGKNDDYIYAKPGKYDDEGYFTYLGEDGSLLTYNLNGQACDETHNAAYFNYSQTVKQGESFTVQGATALPNPECTDETGLEFKYWYLQGDTTETQIDLGSALSANDDELTLVAKWEAPAPTAKAVFTSSDSTLTFYYDNSSHPEATTKFDVDPSWTAEASPFGAVSENATTVNFDASFINYKHITSMKCWFRYFRILTTVNNLQNIDTSEVTTLFYIFTGNYVLQAIDLSNNDLHSVTNMNGAFSFCSVLTSIKLPLEADKIASEATCEDTFKSCKKLSEINSSYLKFKGATYGAPFAGCTSLYKIITKTQWNYLLSALLGETSTEGYSNWYVNDAETPTSSHDINGDNTGATYTKYDPRTRIDFKNVDGGLNYYPIFDSVPEGVQFFGDDGIEYTSMNANITYAMIMPGCTVNAIREIFNLSWNQIFQTSGSSKKATGIKDDFASQYLKSGESVPVIEDSTGTWSRANPPTINGFAIADIRSAYESAGLKVSPWSWWICTASTDNAWCWNSATKNWMMSSRTSGSFDWTSLVIQREFTVSADTYEANKSMLAVLFDWVSMILNIN